MFLSLIASFLLAGRMHAAEKAAAPAEALQIFAAASLQEVLEEIAAAYREKHPQRFLFHFASSGTLAQQESARNLIAVVYRTDLQAHSDTFVELLPIPPDPKVAIRYEAVLLKNANPSAQGFHNFLSSGEASALFQKHGFLPLEPHAP